MVTVCWLTFSLVMGLTLTRLVMQDRQPFTLLAGEQFFCSGNETKLNPHGLITVCISDSYQAREHLHYSPDDAVWSWPAPHRPAGKNITASCSHWGQHVSANNKQHTSLFCFSFLFFCISFVSPHSHNQNCDSHTDCYWSYRPHSVAVHYLWETGMFRFSDTDMYQVTPLHLAASTGNTEVVRYLLRDQVWYNLHSLAHSCALAD